METVRVELPSALLKAANLEDGGNVSQAAALCQTPLAAFMEFAAQHEVPPLRFNYEDLDQERRSSDHLKA
jgi:hypothetical protein